MHTHPTDSYRELVHGLTTNNKTVGRFERELSELVETACFV
jgi:hypothetical protein